MTIAEGRQTPSSLNMHGYPSDPIPMQTYASAPYQWKGPLEALFHGKFCSLGCRDGVRYSREVANKSFHGKYFPIHGKQLMTQILHHQISLDLSTFPWKVILSSIFLCISLCYGPRIERLEKLGQLSMERSDISMESKQTFHGKERPFHGKERPFHGKFVYKASC